MDDKKIKKNVKKRYSSIATQNKSCCQKKSCCGAISPEEISRNIGYSDEEINAVPDGANLGLGCGNPTAIASLKQGEIVLDLGSGAGFDCFLAANKVGKSGKVIGVDMTSEMIEKAKENAIKANYDNVEFRLGDIEKLPVDSNFFDVVISNCVINLSPDKLQVFNEIYRVLKSGGRLAVSDIVLEKELPDFIKNSVEAYTGCIAGALKKNQYLDIIKQAGFQDIKITDETSFPIDSFVNESTTQAIIKKENISKEELDKVGSYVVSIKVLCKK